MNNIAIVNGIDISQYVFKELVDNNNTIQLVAEYSQNLPEVDKVVLFSKDISLKFPCNSNIALKDWNLKKLLLKMKEVAKGYDNIFYYYLDCPFLDKKLSDSIYKNHEKYLADYTFADGYPYGLTPEVISYSIIDRLIKLSEKTSQKINRDSIFEIIKKDINAFDIETEISPKDMRLLRVKLAADKNRNFILLKEMALDGFKNAESIIDYIEKNPETLRTLPAFYSIQIVEGCPQSCSYCVYPVFGGDIRKKKKEMKISDFSQIIDSIVNFCEEAVINISLWGEPSSHTGIIDIIRTVLEREKLDLVIETSGIGWDMNALREISKTLSKHPIWIVSLDAWKEEIYTTLRGNGYKEAYSAAEQLLEIFPEKVYLQAVRMINNEDDLEHFYKNWQKKTKNIIIQKYDNFCGILPDNKVTDLSPLDRIPCWHLKRDLNILIDGTIPLCREDVYKKITFGNIFSDSLDSIWEKGKTYYQSHLSRDYPDLCKKCDEYYTFNF